jgi:hypothetical protein
VMEKLAPDYQWWDHIYEEAKEDGEALGFDVRNIYFTGFYSQGDGACWTGYVDVVRWLELNKADDPNAHILCALIEEKWVDDRLEITRNSYQYEHSNTMNHGHLATYLPVGEEEPHHTLQKGIFKGAWVDKLVDAMGMGFVDEMCVDMLQAARDYADEIYKRLRDEYEHLCGEEVIAQTCDANEYLFDEDGRMV